MHRAHELRKEYIEDITRWREDMNFMFEWQTQYLTSERSERVRYCVCHENIKFISSSQRVMFFLLYGDKISEIAHFYSLLVASVEKFFENPQIVQGLLFVFSLSKLSENSFTCSSFSKTNLLATAIILNNTEATTHSVHSTK